MTRYYVYYNHTSEWADWNSVPERLRRETFNNQLMVVDAESETEARKAVREAVKFTDTNEIVSVSTDPPAGLNFLADKPMGFYKAVPKSERPKFA